MNEEIEEILKLLELTDNNIMWCDEISLNTNQCHNLLDFITNLQTIEQQYSAILSENAELENKITNLEQENENKISESLSYDLAVARIKELEQENDKLKEVAENITTMTVCGDRKQIKNTAQYKLEIAQSRIEKAIELIKGHKKYQERLDKNDTNYSIMEIALCNRLLNILTGGDEE